ncbi:BEACH domain-containing protein [Heterostelium album PN500]|uniref:BEACH domain-containing protein n=1 Tax=Heterostelium pallidum (strain ATCC 26659 / Pp 5 / PN500) TaxID=670386 RepID=D3BJH7_HETP5|nr:BEACH domain-containing protein [Heterostelium album PN500]EFA78057.1 BEACH domain-containing protein [Heterostelium album PN500]|eukprot:XP_020430184.1 BEACH domain-containing protein [Heterostelium album PN500]
MAMFRRMKDLVKDLPLFQEQQQQQQQQQQTNDHLSPRTTTTTTTSGHHSPLSPTPQPITPPTPPIRRDYDSYANRSTTTTTTTNQQQQQQQPPSIDLWSIFTSSEVPSVKQQQASTAKLRSLWQDFLSSKSDRDKISRLNRLLPHFIALAEDQKLDVRNMTDIFGNNAKAFAFAVSRRLVKDLQELAKLQQQQQPGSGGTGQQQQPLTKEMHSKEVYKYFSQAGSNMSFGTDLTDLYPPTITYINSKKILLHLIQDLNNYFAFTTETYVAICQMIIKILQESSKKSAILLDDFHKIDGYNFLLTSLFRLESSKEKAYLIDFFLDSLCSLIYVGYGHITIPESSPVPYQTSISHNLKEISNQLYITKNESAFLDYEFLSNPLKYHVMKIVCFVVTVLNYVPFQELSTFSLLLNENPSVFTLEMIYQLISTLVNFEFRYKHIFREAGLLDILIKVIDLMTIELKKETPIDHITYQTLKIKNNNSNSSNSEQHQQQQQHSDYNNNNSNVDKNNNNNSNNNSNHNNKQQESFTILLDSIYLLTTEHPDNIAITRRYGFFDTLLCLVPYGFVRGKALRILQQLIKYDPDISQREFDGLIKILTMGPHRSIQMKTDIFNAIRKLFGISKYARDSFREHGGFVAIISVLIGMESSFIKTVPEVARQDQDQQQQQQQEKVGGEGGDDKQTVVEESEEDIEESVLKSQFEDNEKLALLESICRITTSALCGNTLNRTSFEQQIGYSTFASGLMMTGVLSTLYASRVVDFIFDMVTENLNGSEAIGNRMLINNVDAFLVILDIIPHIDNPDYVLDIIKRLNEMADYGRFNQEALSKLSIPDWILTKFPKSLMNVNDPLQPHLLKLIQTVGANCLSGSELRRFVRLLQPEHSPEVLLKILASMAKSPSTPPYFEFNPNNRVSHGYIHLPIQQHQWPPTNGYTIIFWLYIEKNGPQIDLLQIYSEDKRSNLTIFIKSGVLTVHILNNSKYVIEFPSFTFEEGKWYHIGIVHSRRLLSGTDFKLFVNGFLKQTASKAQYPAQASGNLFCDIGSALPNRYTGEQIWRIGPFYLTEEPMSSKHINTIYFLGPNYSANFKGRFSPYQTYEIINHQNLTAIKELDYGDQLGPLNLVKLSMQIDESHIIIGLCANNKRITRKGHGINQQNNEKSTLPPHIEYIVGSSRDTPTKDPDVKVEIINQADLSGKLRGQLMGNVEAFRRNKVADGIRKIGGMPVALLLLEKANSSETLHDAMRLLVGVIQGHSTNTHEMSQINGYELGAWVLRRKSQYFNNQIIELLFDIVGINGNISVTGVANRNEGTVANWNACKYILMNYQLWKNTSLDIQKFVLQGFSDLIVDNHQHQFNSDSLRKIHLIQDLFDILQDDTVCEDIVPNIITVLFNMFNEKLIEDDVRLISAFLISGLNGQPSRRRHSQRLVGGETRMNRTVNRVFQMFLQVVTTSKDTSVIYRRVSSFWSFFFINEQHPPLSVALALRVSVAFFLIKSDYCHSFVKKSGFKLLSKILGNLCGYQEIYVTLTHLLLGSTPQSLLDQQTPGSTNYLEFHELLHIFKLNEQKLYCIEAAELILSLVKRSYEDNYRSVQDRSGNSTGSGDGSTSILDFGGLSPTPPYSTGNMSPHISSTSSSPQSSPLAVSQTIGTPTKESSGSSSTTTSGGQQTNTSSSVFQFVGSLLSKVEERTLELAGALEETDGQQPSWSNKKKRASISISHSQSSANLTSVSSSSSINNNFSSSVSDIGVVPPLMPSATPEVASNLQHTMLTYFMYLFHENHSFQQEFYRATLIESLIAILFPNGSVNLPPASQTLQSNNSTPPKKDRVLDLVLKFLCQIVLSALRKSSRAIPIAEAVLDGTPLKTTDDDYITYHTRILFEILYTIETNITKSEFFETDRGVHVQPIYRSLNRIIFDNNNDADFIGSLCYPLFRLTFGESAADTLESAIKLWKLLVQLKSPFAETLNWTLSLKTQQKGEVIDLRPGFDLLVSKGSGEFNRWMLENITQLNMVFEENAKRAHLNFTNAERKSAADYMADIKYRRKERTQKREKTETKASANEKEKNEHTTKKVEFFVRTEAERKKKIKQLENDKQKFNAKQFEAMRDQITRERAVWGPTLPSPLDKFKLDSTEGPYRMRKKTEKNYDFYKNYPYIPVTFVESNSSLIPLPCSDDSKAFMDIAGTPDAELLEPAYWKFTTADGTVLSSSSPALSSADNNNEQQSSQSGTRPSSSTKKRSSSLLSSVNSISSGISTSSKLPSESGSPLNASTDITPPESPLQSSSEDITEGSESKLFTLTEDEKQSILSGDVDTDTNQQSGTPSLTSQAPPQAFNQPDEEEIEEQEENTGMSTNEEENLAFTRLLDPYDQTYLREEMRRNPKLGSVMFNCGSVDGMDKIEGILLFCPVNLYIFDGYAKDEHTGEISEVEEKINMEWMAEGTVLPAKKVISHNYMKWGWDDVREVLKRRHLLRPVAIELFSTDGRNTLIVFKDEMTREEVHYRIVTNVSNNSIGDVSGISGSQTVEDDRDLGVKEKFTSIWRKSPLTLKWQQRQISNFQYLMHLNTLAGRSYNDLTQYPVFPWVLRDYESDDLDLDDQSVYRDLSKPMGALDEQRAEKFRERFENWDDQELNEHNQRVPKFHYGTHYSSAAIVLYYLIRLEPFTQHFLKLQSGRWDQADRLFSSISEAWTSSSCGSTGSIMELIPEFYYLPEFLLNTNKFNFGNKQGGEAINDVVLPPWAKGSVHEFIRLHRKALESDYVSEHIHEWIDLIFGYRQQGKAAEDALNVFYYLTYEGAVNIDLIEDPIEKAATIAQINNFGQTPKQLFDKPHPKRQSILPSFPFYAKTLVGNFIKDIGEPVGQIRLINERCAPAGFYKHLLPPNFTRYLAWGLPDGSIRYHSAGDKVKALEDHHDGPLTCLTATDDGNICVSGGTDSMVCVYNLKKFSLSKRLIGHTGTVTALAASRPYSVIVSGSEDQTCIIWDLNRLCYTRTLTGHDGPISCIGVHDTTGDIVTCSGTTINIYTINGDLMLSYKTSQIIYDQITSVLWSKGPEWLNENVLITGHRDGKIKIWGLESRLLPSIDNEPLSPLAYKNVIILRATFHSPTAHTNSVTSIYLTNDQQKLYSGDIDGRVCMWSDNEITQVRQRGWGGLNTDLRTILPTGTTKK